MTAIDLNYQEDGDGPPLLVLHGLFGSLSNWKGIARRLAGEFRVITADLRNHGRSPWHDDVSYPAMAADVARLLDRANAHGAVLVGHSMGGKVAMTLALQQPERIAGLVVVDIAPVDYGHSHIDLIRTLQEVDLERIGKRQDLDAALAAAGITDPGLRMFLSQNLVFDAGRYRWRINLSALADGMELLTGFPGVAGSYTGPALFVYGGESDYVLPEYLPAIESLFPGAELLRVEDAGHWVHAQAPDRIIEAIRKTAG